MNAIGLLAGIMAIGLFLRTFDLGRTALWIDEITIVMFGAPPRTTWQIIQAIYAAKFGGFTGQHMPFQYLLANWAQQVHPWAGNAVDTFWLRLPFALLGVGTIPLVYLACRRFYGSMAGLWSALLVSVSFFHVYVSRDATSYSPLLFFLALNWWGLAELLQSPESPVRKKIACVIYGLGALGALFTHMTAWLTLGAQGLFLVVAHVRHLRATQPKPAAGAFFRGPYATCALILLISTIPVLPMVLGGMSQFNKSTTGEAAEPITLALLTYQLAFFGWGRTSGRLTAFLVVLIAGIFFLFWNRDKRSIGLFHLGLIILPAIFFFVFLGRGYFPRYLAVVHLPLLGLAGVGLSSLCTHAGRLAHRPGLVLKIGGTAVVTLLIIGHLQPYRVLFSMSDKLHPISKVRDWIIKNVPEGGLYVWRNSYFLREIPQTLSVGRRYTAESDYPNVGVPDAVYESRSQIVRDYFQRIPLAVLIVEPDEAYSPRFWPWIQTDFARKEHLTIHPELEKLWRLGFGYHGFKEPVPFDYYAHYNTADDVMQRSRQNNQPITVIPQFGQWRFVPANSMQLLLTPAGPSALQVYNAGTGSVTGSLTATGMANAPGKIMVRHERDGRLISRNDLSYNAAPSMEMSLGRYEFMPGITDISVTPAQGGQPSLFLYSFAVRTDEIK